MKIIVTGATGFIGSALVKRLMGRHELVIFSRNVPHARKVFGGGIGIQFADWNQPPSHLAALVDGSRALINLAGAGIGSGRWTDDRKCEILWSRIQTTRMLHDLLKASEIRLDVVIQASAVGYYGNSLTRIFDEESEAGKGFLSQVATKWEETARELSEISNRLIFIRSGMVLSSSGGVLPKMALPFRFFAGGRIGNGRQPLSWIDLEDELEAIQFLLKNQHCNGVYNLVSPNSHTQAEFATILAKVLKRPALMRVPSFLIRMLLGEMGSELLLNGQKVMPKRLLESGFKFQYPLLEDALKANYD